MHGKVENPNDCNRLQFFCKINDDRDTTVILYYYLSDDSIAVTEMDTTEEGWDHISFTVPRGKLPKPVSPLNGGNITVDALNSINAEGFE